jgi:hypothetical protein
MPEILMHCGRCSSELEIDEKWDGSIIHRCPLCNCIRVDSKIAPREISILPGGDIAAILSGMKIMGEMEDNRYSENDKWDD